MGFANGHLARCAYQAVNGRAQVVNTLHYDLVGVGLASSPTLQALADRLADDTLNLWRALFPPTWAILPIAVTDEHDPQNPDAPRSGAAGGAGGPGTGSDFGPGNALPAPLCGLATLRTANLGRSFRGRLFLPPVWNELQTNDGGVAFGLLSQYRAFVDAIPHAPDLITGFSLANAHWVVYSRTRRGRGVDPYASPITTATVTPKLHWLRSRDDA